MATVLFLVALIAVLYFLIRGVVKTIKHQATTTELRSLALIVSAYILIWTFFYFSQKDIIVPLGTDICFDDWCATVTHIERPLFLSSEKGKIVPDGQFVLLHIRMSNHAKGIAQKPSEPKVHIIDGKGHSWNYSQPSQDALERLIGKQIPIDQKLALHQSLETTLVFDIPLEATDLKALITEGPAYITAILMHDDRILFQIH